MSRIPVSTLSPSHPRAPQEPLSFPTDRAVSPVPSSRHNSVHSAPMSSLSGHVSSTGKKLSKRALGDEASISILSFFLKMLFGCVPWLGQDTQTSHWHLFFSHIRLPSCLRLIPVTGATQKNRTRALPQANHINHPAKWSPTWRKTQCCQGHRGGAQAQPSPHRSGHHHRRGSKSALRGQEDRLRSCRRR